jgi:UDP-glucose 4-epimerase
MQRIAITGSSGYLGRKLVRALRSREGCEILGIDLKEPDAASAPDRFLPLDITAPELVEQIEAFAPDTVIHSAFVFQPMHNERRMRQINLDGLSNVLAAVESAEVARFMQVSSATAYGAWPDNPVPMDESQPLRASKYQYAADKTEIESIVAEFRREHPSCLVSTVRPAIIGGKNMENYLSRFIFGMPFLAKLDGYDTPLQFVHEDDVVAAMLAILEADAEGPFNIGPPNWTAVTEIAAETNRSVWSLPLWLAKPLHSLAWNLRLPVHESPASFLDFARYPWVVAPKRLEDELSFAFQYSSTDTMHEILAGAEERKQR